jgi:hypothetical protein
MIPADEVVDHVMFVRRNYHLRTGGIFERVRFHYAFHNERAQFETFIADELRLDQYYTAFAGFVNMSEEPLLPELRARLPAIAQTLRGRLQRITETYLLPCIMAHVGQWTIEGRHRDIGTLLHLGANQTSMLRSGRKPAGELYTEFTADRQPERVRFRTTKGELYTILTAYTANLLPKDEYEEAVDHNNAIDELLLRARRDGSQVTYTCPYASPPLSLHHAIYRDQVAHWRRLYPTECGDVPPTPSDADSSATDRLTIDTAIQNDEQEPTVEHVAEDTQLPQATAPDDVVQQAEPIGTPPSVHASQVRLAEPQADAPPAQVVVQLVDGQPAAPADAQSAPEEAQPAAQT